MIKFRLNKVTNLHQLTLHSMTSCPTHGDCIVTTDDIVTSPYVSLQ